MKGDSTADDRQRLLAALLEYAKESGTFNPHFQKKEMMARLGIDEREFNIMQKRLGDKYCCYTGPHDGDDRYAISLSECFSLQHQFDQEQMQKRRHRELVGVAVAVGVLAAFLSAVLSGMCSHIR